MRFFPHNRHHIRGGASSTLAAAAILPPHHPATLSSLRAASSDTTAAAADKKKPIPTILLAGFLGSGKTSTLKHLLENNQNIESELFDSNNDNRIDSMADGVVELQMAVLVASQMSCSHLWNADRGRETELDAIVVELSGVADPVAGHPATKLADLKRTVTLVDSSTFGTDWMTFDVAGERESWTEPGDDCSAVRKVPELLAEQVEAANLLLINKIDLAGEKQVKVASGLARGLNENASIMEVEFGKVDVKELLGKALGSADTQTTSADQLGIGSFVYRASTPFNSQRLMALLNRWPIPIKDSLDFGLVMGLGEDDVDDAVENKAFVGVLRSKGFCWMAPTKWSNSAGNDVGVTILRCIGVTPESTLASHRLESGGDPYFANNVKEYDRIMAEDWVSEEWGDRRQELVFIGMKLDEAEIRAALDACLCTADEMEVYRAQVRNILEASFSSVKGGPSLFDVGGMDHIDQ
ncbi:CobW C-terminal domain-containing protein [Skeletonema marinoi]|uniref:CobW C-terminal domain-containing protein n=1 Tax=Skeletonema marinoi TaxID=267567 RepID=A0AAD8YPZ6_9STRA|nr:CobW C-terminal domain-containing protein [Skeletonema marinoi]